MTSQHNAGGLTPSRRTLVKGAAWSVPVVAMAAPAFGVTCSQDPSQPKCGCLAGVASDTCKYPGEGSSNPAFNKTFRTKICFSAKDCGPRTTSTVKVTSIIVTGQGNSCPRDVTSDIPEAGFPITDGGPQACYWVFFRDDNSGTKVFTITYTVDGAGPYTLIVTPSPNAYSDSCAEGCSTTTAPCPPYTTVATNCDGTPAVKKEAAAPLVEQDPQTKTTVEPTVESTTTVVEPAPAQVEAPAVVEQAPATSDDATTTAAP